MATDIQDELLKAIDIGVTKRIKDAAFDVSYIGVVEEYLGNNYYTIKYNGTSNKVKTVNANLQIGDTVHVVFPQNSTRTKYVLEDIIGSSGGGGGSDSVTSVNGKTGAVMLAASDVGALSSTYKSKIDAWDIVINSDGSVSLQYNN